MYLEQAVISNPDLDLTAIKELSVNHVKWPLERDAMFNDEEISLPLALLAIQKLMFEGGVNMKEWCDIIEKE